MERVAEEVMFDEVSAGASNDIQKATKIAKAMVRSWGMSSLGPIQYDDGTGNVFLGRDYGSGSNYSGEIAYEIDKENNDMPEFDLKNHALIPLLRREISAHFHCHRADDMFTAVRIAKEFDLKLVIVHATEGHLIADILGTEKLSAISGPVICDRCKPEMKGLELKNTAELIKKRG